MDILTIISIVFLVFFIVIFLIMVAAYIRSRKDSKELNTSMHRDIKRNPLSVVMITVLFAIITSVIFGTTNGIDYANDKINEIYEESNVYHASIEATRFIPDEFGKTEAKIDVEKIYDDYPVENLDEIVDYLYTDIDSEKLTIADNEIIEDMVKRDFLIADYSYGNGDITSANILHIFYLLKQSKMDISFKYQPAHLGKLPSGVGVNENGLSNNTEIKIIRDENDISYIHKGETVFPTSKKEEYETNITFHQKENGREIINNQASVGDQFYKAQGFTESEDNELIMSTINGDANIKPFEIVDINQTPQNIVPPAFQNQVQFGEITHDMTTTLITSDSRFDEITMDSGKVKFDNGDIAVHFNDVKRDGHEFNTIEYNEQIDKNVLELETELAAYLNSVPPISPWSSTGSQIRSTNPIVYAWNMDTYYKANASMQFALVQQDTVILISNVIIPVFSILSLLIILLFLKRRTEVNQQYNMTLKSLGYSPIQIAVSYLVFPFVILITGWAFGMLVGQSIIQAFWMNRTQQLVSFQVEMYNDFIGSFLFLFGILIFISVIAFLFVTLLLKKNIVEVMNGSTEGKPNAFVRISARKTKTKTKFTTSYRRSNLLRQMSKSLFIFVAIATSTIVFLFGATTASFADLAKGATADNFNFDYIHYGDKTTKTVREEDIKDHKSYNFGSQGINSHVYDSGGMKIKVGDSTKTYQYGNPNYESTDSGLGQLWYQIQKDVVGYMETASLHKTKITIEMSDIMQVVASGIAASAEDAKLTLSQHYAANKTKDAGTLYTLMSINAFVDTAKMEYSATSESDVITETEFDDLYNKKEFYVGGMAGNETYEDLTLASLYSKVMDVAKSNVINILPKLSVGLEAEGIVLRDMTLDLENPSVEEIKEIIKVIQILDETLEDHGILTNEQYITDDFDQVSIGIGKPLYTNGDPIETNIAPLHIPDPEEFGEYYSLEAINGDSIVNNHMSYNVEDSIPVYIPFSESETSGLEIGDYFKYVVTEDLLQDEFAAANPDHTVKFQVVGIYSSYFTLGYPVYAGGTDETDIGDTLASKVFKTTQSHNSDNPLLEDQYNSIITKSWGDLSTYGTWYSEGFETIDDPKEWVLLDSVGGEGIVGEENLNQLFFTYQTTFVAPIPFSIVPTVVEIQYEDFDQTMQLFIWVSFIISMLVILIIIKEIVDNTKSEVSTIKAMGYGKYKSASLVAESQIVSMMISAAISVPISLGLISLFEQVLLVKMGLVTSFTANLGILLAFIAIMAIILTIAYTFIIFLLRNTSALLSTKE